VTDRGRAQAVAGALAARKDLVSQVSKPVEGPPGARLSVTLVNAPYDTTTLAQVPELRRVAKQAGGETTLVGGPTAQEYDLRQSATRDNRMIIPLTLVVVFLILAVLLRALFAPLLLVLSVILSFAAALGFGIFVSDAIFGFPGVDPALPLLCFVFLVALGIDTTSSSWHACAKRRSSTARARARCAAWRSPGRSSPARASCSPEPSARSPCRRSSC
jgi:RND superfamily putative drug exporter